MQVQVLSSPPFKELMSDKKVKESKVEGRTLVVKEVHSDKEFKITIPADAMCTFGPTAPYASGGKGQGGFGMVSQDKGWSLRVYATKSKTDLIAVFSGVESFRDISMPMARLVIREAGKSVWKSDEEGYKMETEGTKEKAWEEFKLLGQ